MSVPIRILAHQGGWDEILMVAGPLLVFAGVLFLANRRANAKLAEAAEAQGASGTEVDGAFPDTDPVEID